MKLDVTLVCDICVIHLPIFCMADSLPLEQSYDKNLGPDSIYKYFLTSIGNPIMEMILRLSYLHNGISYTGKMASLYWISPMTDISKTDLY